MSKSCLFLLYLLYECSGFTVNVQTGIIGPWRQIEVTSKHLTSNILKRSFVSKLFFEEGEEIDQDEQIESITRFGGLVELEMINVGQVEVPVFKNLNIIKSMKLSGNRISYVNNKSFSKITPKYIDLSNNQIDQIHDGAFGDLLEKLILNCNNLETVSSTWFTDPDSLQGLWLTGNKITVIPDNFKVFSSLWEIRMSYNKINEIQPGALSQKSYTYIDISYNDLKELKASIFSSKLVEIMYLNVRANKLNFLSNEFMNKTKLTVEFTTDLNPWLCPCNELIRKWLPVSVLYNKKNSWLDAQVLDHSHRKDAFCIKDEFGSDVCNHQVDDESTKFYFEQIEPFDTLVCEDF